MLPELWHLHRAHPGSLARVPNDLARQGLSRIRHSHACHRRTSSEGARQRKQAAHTAGGRLDEECCCAALPRVAAQRLHYGTRERTCKGQQNNERLHGLVQPPRARAPLVYNTAAQTALFVQNSGVVAYGEWDGPLALLCSAWPGVLLSLGSSAINDRRCRWTLDQRSQPHKHFCPPRVAVRSRTRTPRAQGQQKCQPARQVL